MKLQYLGDARDAFKWDLLHWICTDASFSTLVFVPLLTLDDEDSGEGLTPHHRFKCQDFIRPFLDSLKEEPRCLTRISALGKLNHGKQFRVRVFAPDKLIGSGNGRSEYWSDLDPSELENAVVFFDPDNGYETKTQRGPKWIEHGELKRFLERLPETSVVVVYQHRPRRTWGEMFADLSNRLGYVHTAVAAHESNLAFIGMAGNDAAGKRIANSMEQYAKLHPAVTFTTLLSGASQAV